jgi:hypothetical protein
MKRIYRPAIPQRRLIFFGCEGESERSYGALLDQLLKLSGYTVHLDIALLKPGGGDPLQLVERACKLIDQREKKYQTRYAVRAVLLDSDRVNQTRRRDNKFREIVKTANLKLIWQHPCHEAFLLRHLDGCTNLQPKTSAEAKRKLLKHWPAYRKGLPAIRLRDRIGLQEILQVMKIEPDLADFLISIGLTR